MPTDKDDVQGRLEPSPPVIDTETLTIQLSNLGIDAGMVVQLHCAFSKIAPIEGGPGGLISALLHVLGPAGTLVMPSMTEDDNSVFDPRTTSCAGMGVVADTFWRQQGVLRSDNPHAFAAAGLKASAITAPHPVTVPHGPDSPIGRVHYYDGFILLVGVGHEANTAIHLAEVLQKADYCIPQYSTVLQSGRQCRVHYYEAAACAERFSLVDQPLDSLSLQRRGRVGHAEARLVRSREVVQVARNLMAKDSLIFLHEPDVCENCDEARAWLPASRKRALLSGSDYSQT